MTDCLVRRRDFILDEFQKAIDEEEIKDVFTSEELTDMVLGTLNRDLLNRRLKNDTKSHEQVSSNWLGKLSELLKPE